MPTPRIPSSAERRWLSGIAAIGFIALNGTFVYGLLHRELARAAMTNPLALAFMIEALLLVALFAYLLPRWGVTRLGRLPFVVLSLFGGLAFSLPIALLMTKTGDDD